MAWLFSVSLFLVFHAYLGYPLTLKVIGLFRRLQVEKGDMHPTVSLVITAYNEQSRIQAKLENTLLLDYPRERLQILVASDGSTDRTNGIVQAFSGRGVELVACPQQKGKENAQKAALGRCTGDVIVFSDVATNLDPHGLSAIVSNFSDPTVGCVSSVDRVIDREGKPCGEGFYVRYEMWLRRLESQVCSLVGLSGSFFAARREVCVDFEGDVQSDFRTLLASIRLGLRGVCDPEAVGYYPDISDTKREFDRKVRTVLRGMTVFFRYLRLLNPLRYRLFSYQYFCHKLLRWLVPLFLMVALTGNVMLSKGSFFYGSVLGIHLLFYGIGIWGMCACRTPSGTAAKIATYFVAANLAIVVAWWQFLTGKRMVMWLPSQR